MIIYVYILICAYTVNQLVGLIASNSQFSSFKSHVVLLNSQFPFFFQMLIKTPNSLQLPKNIVQSSFSIIFPTPVAFPLAPCCPPLSPPGPQHPRWEALCRAGRRLGVAAGRPGHRGHELRGAGPLERAGHLQWSLAPGAAGRDPGARARGQGWVMGSYGLYIGYI